MDGHQQALEIDFRLMQVHQEWLDGQQKNMIQWLYAHDVLLTINSAVSIALVGTVFFLAWKVEKLERLSHEQDD